MTTAVTAPAGTRPAPDGAARQRGRSAAARPVAGVLGLQEGLRLLRHPVAMVGLALAAGVMLTQPDNTPRDAFETVTGAPTFYYGVFVYFAASLVASRDRRARSGELLAAAPSPAATRVAALCVAALLPAAVCAVLVLAVHTGNSARELYVVAPTGWHLAQGPLTVLGGALLGVMVARLTAVPGTALLVMVAMVAVNAWLGSRTGTLSPLGTYVGWARYVPGEEWSGLNPGSAPWHAAYLTGLCAMAACGAFLREGPRRRVLSLGAALTALTVVLALEQLP